MANFWNGVGDSESSSAPYSSNHGAALLLLTVRTLASIEIDSDEEVLRPNQVVSGPSDKLILNMNSKNEEGGIAHHHHSSFLASEAPRPRTVSMSSVDVNLRSYPGSPIIISKAISPTKDSPMMASLNRIPCLDSPVRSKEIVAKPSMNTERKFVGTEAKGPVRGILRKKFNWKAFPELEGYLIENRHQYLQYSSSLNYTAEQKRYNNRLTQGLLELAAESGYIFEDFTFAAIRDRIRCYYKSYVQAVKKKKRKKKRRA